MVSLLLIFALINSSALLFSADDGEFDHEYNLIITSPSGEEIFHSYIPSPTQIHTPRNPVKFSQRQVPLQTASEQESSRPGRPTQAFGTTSPCRSQKKSRITKRCCLMASFIAFLTITAGTLTGFFAFQQTEPKPPTPCLAIEIEQCHVPDKTYNFNNICPAYNGSCAYAEQQLQQLCSLQAAIDCTDTLCESPCQSLEQVKDEIRKTQ